MQIRFTPEQDAWRQEVRDFLDAELPPEMGFDVEFDEDEALWEFSVAFTKKVGAKGWLGLNWPTEYGGLARPPIDRMIMSEEFEYREAPLCGSISWGLTAGSLLAGGTEEQKRYWLPQLGRLDLHAAEGLSEPGAGSDLASLKTTAYQDGSDWVVNGQKTYTTWGTHADCLFTAARTDPNSKRHHGITMFLIPYDLPGISMTPMMNLGGGQQNHTYLDNVRVPEEYMIGEVGGGWKMIMNAFYGGGIHAGHAYYERTFAEVLEHCRREKRRGRLLIEDPLVRQQLGQLALMLEQARMLTYESVSNYNNQIPPQFGGALGVVVSKEMRPRFFEMCQEIVGPLSQLKPNRFAPMGGQAEAWYRQSYANHAGGTSQVKRMVLATRGLGLPR
ncbi:acyl-CoA dehydrogenase family protein [Myxococcota bacterium]|nr:acyl-CoA dehydrogenase family protein [Myxococcota bacterium]